MKKILLFALITLSNLAIAGTQVEFKTSAGDFVIELNDEKAPISTENFLTYVKSDFYTGTIFHRVINGFMIQGGGFTKNMQQKSTNSPIQLESKNGLKNIMYSVAMARTGNPNSATSQFFINVVDNPNLDYPKPDGNGYAVFGMVIKGTDTINKIKQVVTSRMGPYSDVPVNSIVIQSAKVISQ